MSLRKQDLFDLFSFLSNGATDSLKKQILACTGRGNTSASRDYVAANCLLSEAKKACPTLNLSTISTKDELLNLLHPATKFRLRSYTPCLAARYDELKEKEQKQIFNDPDWVATEKLNGCRGWLICTPDGQVHLYSRNYSDKDCSLLEYWNNVYQTVSAHDDIYAIDVEVMFEPGADISKDLAALGLETDSQLEAMVALLHTYPETACDIQKKFKDMFNRDLISFNVIAPLYFKGRNYVNRTLGEGEVVYNECVAYGQSLGLNVKAIAKCSGNATEKENFLNRILDAGGEGVVFHYNKGQYCTSENRSKTAYIKLKRTISATIDGQGLGDQIDGFVTGFKMGSVGTANEGLISALEFSINVVKDGKSYVHQIASCPNIDLATKQMLTINDASGLYPQEWIGSDGQVHVTSMNPEFDHLVAELSGQALSAVSQRLEHPRILRWRVERFADSCIYTQEWLDSQTTNKGITYSAGTRGLYEGEQLF